MRKIIIQIDSLNDLKRFYRKLRWYMFFYRNKEMRLNISNNISIDIKNELLEIEIAFNKKDKYERLKYIYYKVCEILDKPIEKNICEFDKNGLCIAQREGKHSSSMNGCCGTCKYISEKGCTICSISCKTFYCSYIKKIKNIPNYKDIKLYKYFFSIPQKLIINTNFWNTPEENLQLLYKANIITWLFYHNKKMNRF